MPEIPVRRSCRRDRSGTGPTFREHRCWILGILASLAVAAACSGKSSPDSPTTPTTPTTPSCRTFAAEANVTTVSQGQTQTARLTGAFNAATNSSTVTTALPNGTVCTTSLSLYRSKDDFIDEVRVIPGVSLPTSTTTSNSGICGASTSTVTYVYDGERRLTSFTTLTLGVASTTTYTAWDASGRPTAGSFPGTSIQNTYDNTTRTMTQTQTSGSATSTAVTTWDANGNQTSVVVQSGPVVTTTTYSTTATSQVCK